jgi:hypothetical protein
VDTTTSTSLITLQETQTVTIGSGGGIPNQSDGLFYTSSTSTYSTSTSLTTRPETSSAISTTSSAVLPIQTFTLRTKDGSQGVYFDPNNNIPQILPDKSTVLTLDPQTGIVTVRGGDENFGINGWSWEFLGQDSSDASLILVDGLSAPFKPLNCAIDPSSLQFACRWLDDSPTSSFAIEAQDENHYLSVGSANFAWQNSPLDGTVVTLYAQGANGFEFGAPTIQTFTLSTKDGSELVFFNSVLGGEFDTSVATIFELDPDNGHVLIYDSVIGWSGLKGMQLTHGPYRVTVGGPSAPLQCAINPSDSEFTCQWPTVAGETASFGTDNQAFWFIGAPDFGWETPVTLYAKITAIEINPAATTSIPPTSTQQSQATTTTSAVPTPIQTFTLYSTDNADPTLSSSNVWLTFPGPITPPKQNVAAYPNSVGQLSADSGLAWAFTFEPHTGYIAVSSSAEYLGYELALPVWPAEANNGNNVEAIVAHVADIPTAPLTCAIDSTTSQFICRWPGPQGGLAKFGSCAGNLALYPNLEPFAGGCYPLTLYANDAEKTVVSPPVYTFWLGQNSDPAHGARPLIINSRGDLEILASYDPATATSFSVNPNNGTVNIVQNGFGMAGQFLALEYSQYEHLKYTSAGANLGAFGGGAGNGVGVDYETLQCTVLHTNEFKCQWPTGGYARLWLDFQALGPIIFTGPDYKFANGAVEAHIYAPGFDFA